MSRISSGGLALGLRLDRLDEFQPGGLGGQAGDAFELATARFLAGGDRRLAQTERRLPLRQLQLGDADAPIALGQPLGVLGLQALPLVEALLTAFDVGDLFLDGRGEHLDLTLAGSSPGHPSLLGVGLSLAVAAFEDALGLGVRGADDPLGLGPRRARLGLRRRGLAPGRARRRPRLLDGERGLVGGVTQGGE